MLTIPSILNYYIYLLSFYCTSWNDIHYNYPLRLVTYIYPFGLSLSAYLDSIDNEHFGCRLLLLSLTYVAACLRGGVFLESYNEQQSVGCR